MAQVAHMARWDLLAGRIPLKEEWKSVYMDYGVLCAMILGHQLMQLQPANTLDIQLMVCLYNNKNNLWGILLLWFTPTEVLAYGSAHFGQAQLPILLDDVACTGSESRLVDCFYDNDTSDCSHTQDSGTRCHPGMFELCIFSWNHTYKSSIISCSLSCSSY